ncbi:hypothetical protein ABFX02_13G127000 [Erythranthe guttata]
MAKHMSSIWIMGMLVFAMSFNFGESAFSCDEAVKKLIPCQPFLAGAANGVTVQCCDGARSLDQLGKSNPEEVKAICQCLKNAAAAATGVNADRAKQLPGLCNINLPVPIDPNVNCDRL